LCTETNDALTGTGFFMKEPFMAMGAVFMPYDIGDITFYVVVFIG
jgi:hypothetical protein